METGEHGASPDGDRAGAPSELSPQAVSSEAAHPLREAFVHYGAGRLHELDAAFSWLLGFLSAHGGKLPLSADHTIQQVRWDIEYLYLGDR